MTNFLLIVLAVAVVVIGIYAFLYKRLQKKLEGTIAEAAAKEQEMQEQLQSYHTYYTSEVQRVTEGAQSAYDQRVGELEAEAEAYRSHYEAEGKRISDEAGATITQLTAELEQLRKYADLSDAERDVAEKCAAAIEEAEALRAEANQMLEVVRQQSKEEETATKERVDTVYREAEALLQQATNDAAALIQSAETQAQETAGEAYDALRNRHTLEEAAKAIQNVINGYGDRYVTPTRTLLDDLAEGFGHTAAGQSFTMAKARSEQMVLEGKAADCDYVENNRKETAIRFVIDAFNGRVDAIMSRVKSDNLGTLEQQVRDAFSLVNLNGEAFRNARILPEYLESRLAELHWGTVLQELKIKEREEQRANQEQIREEERVRREQARLEKAAAKEEEIARQAYEAALAQMESAGAEERAQYEAQMEALRQQLEDAEAKSQRTKSMAEQTKAGHVYIISNLGSFGDDVYKIGMTRRLEPEERVKELSDASVPFSFDVHAIISTNDAPELENTLHRHFDACRLNQVNLRKEFFRVSLAEIKAVVEEKVLEVQWTIAAEAKEYRETIALLKKTQEEQASNGA